MRKVGAQESLRKENATTALMALLAHLNVIGFRSRPFRIKDNKIWISMRDVHSFLERQVKSNCD